MGEYLHIEKACFNKVGVNAYGDRGRLFRPAAELATATRAARGKSLPLTLSHYAPGDTPPTPIGRARNIAFDGDRATCDLVVWDPQAIAGIRDGTRAALSAGYQYYSQPTRGAWRGQVFDGLMNSIRFHHIGLGERGLLGADVQIKLPKEHPMANPSFSFAGDSAAIRGELARLLASLKKDLNPADFAAFVAMAGISQASDARRGRRLAMDPGSDQR